MLRRFIGFFGGLMLGLFFGLGLLLAIVLDFANYQNSVCYPGSGPNTLYIEDDGKRETVCQYLERRIEG